MFRKVVVTVPLLVDDEVTKKEIEKAVQNLVRRATRVSSDLDDLGCVHLTGNVVCHENIEESVSS